MKTILFVVVIQLVPSPDGTTPPTPEVKTTFTAELGSMAACKNAATGIMRLGEASGFVANAICAPYDIGKLEVEKEKPKPPPKPAPSSHQVQL